MTRHVIEWFVEDGTGCTYRGEDIGNMVVVSPPRGQSIRVPWRKDGCDGSTGTYNGDRTRQHDDGEFSLGFFVRTSLQEVVFRVGFMLCIHNGTYVGRYILPSYKYNGCMSDLVCMVRGGSVDR